MRHGMALRTSSAIALLLSSVATVVEPSEGREGRKNALTSDKMEAAVERHSPRHCNNSLDRAYDCGGPGAGRVINVDSGAVEIRGAGGVSVHGGVAIGGATAGGWLGLASADGAPHVSLEAISTEFSYEGAYHNSLLFGARRLPSGESEGIVSIGYGNGDRRMHFGTASGPDFKTAAFVPRMTLTDDGDVLVPSGAIALGDYVFGSGDRFLDISTSKGPGGIHWSNNADSDFVLSQAGGAELTLKGSGGGTAGATTFSIQTDNLEVPANVRGNIVIPDGSIALGDYAFGGGHFLDISTSRGLGGIRWDNNATAGFILYQAGGSVLTLDGYGAGDTLAITDVTVDVAGLTRTGVLEITGGLDIVEPFAAAGDEEIPRGSLVVIDEKQTGILRVSDRPYDQRVAGVVSGAGGLAAGLRLTQQGRLEGEVDLAMTGRVWCLADASAGAIEPGDLLTTSERPGHAMKAADRRRSHGAVIGKAMSSLEKGTGLVLVLVNLQ